MKYVCAQPATVYFAWQIDVMIFSFLSVGVKPEEIDILCSNTDGIHEHFNVLMQKYPGVRFVFYEDTRDYKGYIPSIKQHLLSKHLRAFPELQKGPIFLHDSDIALTKPINFDGLLDDNIWYYSNTDSYLNYEYIASKGRDVLEMMLSIADISEDIVRCNQRNSGGAQYLMKNVDPDMLDEIVQMSHDLYKPVQELSDMKKREDPEYHPIQIWTAEMWAMLWVPWKKGIMTICPKALDFCWATYPKKKWHKVSIYHNAGVVRETDELFYKGAYNKSMPDLGLTLIPKRCSYNYYNLVKSALAEI